METSPGDVGAKLRGVSGLCRGGRSSLCINFTVDCVRSRGRRRAAGREHEHGDRADETIAGRGRGRTLAGADRHTAVTEQTWRCTFTLLLFLHQKN